MNENVDEWTLAHAWLGFGHLLFDGGPRESAIAAFEAWLHVGGEDGHRAAVTQLTKPGPRLAFIA